MTDNNQQKKQDNQPKPTFTKEDVAKEVTRALEKAREQHFSFEMKRSWNPLPGNGLCPMFSFTMQGGSPEQMDALALQINKLLMDFQIANKMKDTNENPDAN